MSLTWSSLLILSTIGQASQSSPSNSTPGIFPLGLQFTKFEIVLGCLAAALFSFVGFVRSSRTIKILNSKFSESNNVDSILNRMDGVDSAIGEFVESLKSADSSIGIIESSSRSIFSSYREILTEAQKNINMKFESDEILSDLVKSAEMGDDKSTFVGRVRAVKLDFQSLLNSYYARYNKVIEDTEEKKDKIVSSCRQDIDEIANKLEGDKNKILSIVEDLRSFNNSLGKVEKGWYYVYDISPVWLIFATGLFLSAKFLVSG